MDATARQHRREQLREAQRRSRQRRQEALERLTEQNRQLTSEVQRIRQAIRDIVELAWDRWTTGDISNDLLERLVALNNSLNSSGTSSAAEPIETAYSQTPESGSRPEGFSMPFAASPDLSIFRDDRLSYAFEPSEFLNLDQSSTAQSPQIAPFGGTPDESTEQTVSLADIQNCPEEDDRPVFCVHTILYDKPLALLGYPSNICSNWMLSEVLCSC